MGLFQGFTQLTKTLLLFQATVLAVLRGLNIPYQNNKKFNTLEKVKLRIDSLLYRSNRLLFIVHFKINTLTSYFGSVNIQVLIEYVHRRRDD